MQFDGRSKKNCTNLVMDVLVVGKEVVVVLPI